MQIGRDHGVELDVATGTLQANERQRAWAVEKTLQALGDVAATSTWTG